MAQADAICQETNDQLDPIFETIYADTDDVAWNDPANELLLFARRDEAMEQAAPIAEFAGLMEAAAEGDHEALDSSDEHPFDDIDRRAQEYGLTECGEAG